MGCCCSAAPGEAPAAPFQPEDPIDYFHLPLGALTAREEAYVRAVQKGDPARGLAKPDPSYRKTYAPGVPVLFQDAARPLMRGARRQIDPEVEEEPLEASASWARCVRESLRHVDPSHFELSGDTRVTPQRYAEIEALRKNPPKTTLPKGEAHHHHHGEGK